MQRCVVRHQSLSLPLDYRLRRALRARVTLHDALLARVRAQGLRVGVCCRFVGVQHPTPFVGRRALFVKRLYMLKAPRVNTRYHTQ